MDTELITNSLSRPMAEDEILARAREAWIKANGAGKWRTYRTRAGAYDHKLSAIILALRDTARPLLLILSDQDEVAAAVALRTTPGITTENREVVAAALVAALHVRRHF